MLLPFRSRKAKLRKGDGNWNLHKRTITELIREKNLVTAEDIKNMLKEMFSETLQVMLEAELDTELRLPEKKGSKPENNANRRNAPASAIYVFQFLFLTARMVCSSRQIKKIKILIKCGEFLRLLRLT